MSDLHRPSSFVESEPQMSVPLTPLTRRGRRVGVLVVAAALAAAGAVAMVEAGPAFAAATGGVGATLPYVEVQAENAVSNGTVICPPRRPTARR
jgi:hypothetical protein